MNDSLPHLRRFLLALVFCSAISTAGVLNAQAVAPEPVPASAAVPAQTAQTSPTPAPRDVSWRQLPANFLHDQKDIWIFPVAVAQGHHLLPTAAVLGVTAGLLATDAHSAPHFRRTSDFQGFNHAFNGTATGLGVTLAPASFYVLGLIRKDSYEQKTGLLAGEALVDTFFLSSAMKAVSRRLRPSDIAPQGDFSDTFFRSRVTASGFPSGHTITAFAVATVFARRYRSHRWVPWVAYGAAAAIGFSRITLQAHFPADVFLGGALGYSVSRFAVLRQ